MKYETVEEFLACGGKITICPPTIPPKYIASNCPDKRVWQEISAGSYRKRCLPAADEN